MTGTIDEMAAEIAEALRHVPQGWWAPVIAAFLRLLLCAHRVDDDADLLSSREWLDE